MFTGIIESLGKVKHLTDTEAVLQASFAKELELGQSVACDGICLTVTEQDEETFSVQFLEETKNLTALSSWNEGFLVNLERAMKSFDRFDGHIVQAHVEGVGTLRDITSESQQREEAPTWLLTVEIPSHLMKYIIHKGIVILNGIALTVVSKNEDSSTIQVAIIPHTWQNTNLHALKVGTQINVETDVLAKYVENMMTVDRSLS